MTLVSRASAEHHISIGLYLFCFTSIHTEYCTVYKKDALLRGHGKLGEGRTIESIAPRGDSLIRLAYTDVIEEKTGRRTGT